MNEKFDENLKMKMFLFMFTKLRRYYKTRTIDSYFIPKARFLPTLVFFPIEIIFNYLIFQITIQSRMSLHLFLHLYRRKLRKKASNCLYFGRNCLSICFVNIGDTQFTDLTIWREV